MKQETRSPNRPFLSQQEASTFTPATYFSEGGIMTSHSEQWQPVVINVEQIKTQFVVGAQGKFKTIQKAVNAAMTDTGKRVYIKVQPGCYQESVYIPHNAPPITLFGSGHSQHEVIIELAINSMFSSKQYQQTVNAKGQYHPEDPAWPMYKNCLEPARNAISTLCSAVVWAQSDDLQLHNLTIRNSLLDSVDGGDHQAVALRSDGDRVQLQNVSLIGRQDTFFANTGAPLMGYVTDRVSRLLVQDSYIEGDVDYVFGRANAVFENVQFHTVSSRGNQQAYIFAPSTLPKNRYGFLVQNCSMTTDSGYKQLKAKLGRAWDQGARESGYIAGHTANGQLVIKNCSIDSGYDQQSPWGAAATTGRPFCANISVNRDLNDMKFNRLWEFATQYLKQ